MPNKNDQPQQPIVNRVQFAQQLVFSGPQDTKVQGRKSPRLSERDMTIRFGQLLVVVKDRAAFESFKEAAEKALEFGDQLWPEQDLFTEAEQREHLRLATYGEAVLDRGRGIA